MDKTALLKLPYIMPAQSQKHVTHNEALAILDAILHIRVEDRDRNVPPEAPVEGQRHTVGLSPTGVFAGHPGAIAAFQDGAWVFYEPREGWPLWDAASGALHVYHGGGWVAVVQAPEDTPMLGINATADETNRLAVSSPATLFNHEGGGHQIKINKAAPGETGSLLFQTGWSGRAEMGLAGNDDFAVKVSSDGETWHTALSVDNASGATQIPGLGISTGIDGTSGLNFGNLNAASTAAPSNNKTLGLDAEGEVVLRAAGVPAYLMSGTDTDTTLARSYHAQISKGTGIYLSDNAGSITGNPGNEWASTALVGISGSYFSQFVLASTNAYFRGGAISSPATVSWLTLSKQSGLTAGYIPYNYVWGLPHQHHLTNSSIFQGDGRIGIGTAAPDASAILDLASTTRGFLPPRMTSTERDAIATPATGLMIFNTTVTQPQYWNGSAWIVMSA
ncbi:MAG: DUF2793 domain-containing protein [Parvibaculum sp.]|nr:DUF2793 domain-containing protein [Parvibaculum sp.]